MKISLSGRVTADWEIGEQMAVQRATPVAAPASAKREASQLFSPAVIVFLGVLLLRLYCLLRLAESQLFFPNGGDMQFYNDWALRILHGHLTDHRAFYGLPLYAYLLAAIYKICGYSPFVPGLLQACCDAATAVLIFKIAERMFRKPGVIDQFAGARGKVIGVLAATGWALFLPAQTYSIILMPTAGFVFVYWLLVWQILQRDLQPRFTSLMAWGCLIGFTAMGVANILLLTPLILAALFFRWSASLRVRLAGALLLLLGILAGSSPAWLHNWLIARDPVFLSAHSGVNLWVGNNPIATGYPRFPKGLRAGQATMLKDSIAYAENAAGHELRRSEVSAFWSTKARSWIKEHPGSWLKLLGRKTANFWNAYPYDDLSVIRSFEEQSITLPGIGFGLVAAFGLVGFFLAAVRWSDSRWLIAAVALNMISLLPVFITERYRLAAVPGLLILAGCALFHFWESLARSRYSLFAFSLALLAFCCAFVSVPQRDLTLWALDDYNSGLRALDAGRLGIAREKLERAYAYSPRSAEINFTLGNLLVAEGHLDQAKTFYAETLSLDPAHDGALNNAAIIAMQQKNWPAAERLLTLAAKQAPNEAKTHFLLAEVMRQIGDLPGAARQVDLALALSPHEQAFLQLKSSLRLESKSTRE